MAELTAEEKEAKIIAAIGKITTLAKLEKFTVAADASEAIVKAMADKKAELEAAVIDDGLGEMAKDGAVIRVHPDQVAGWEAQGWKVAE